MRQADYTSKHMCGKHTFCVMCTSFCKMNQICNICTTLLLFEMIETMNCFSASHFACTTFSYYYQQTDYLLPSWYEVKGGINCEYTVRCIVTNQTVHFSFSSSINLLALSETHYGVLIGPCGNHRLVELVAKSLSGSWV